MAQHMEVRNEKAPKILQKIGASLEKEVRAGRFKGGLKWEWLYRITGREEDKSAWITSRYIGKGIVWGDTRGSFEVHVNGKVAEHIYLVA